MGMMKAGLMGLGRGGRRVAEVLLNSSWCELVAVASQKPGSIEEFTAEHPGIATYNDYRSMIVSAPLEVLFVAVPPYLRGKYLSLVAERGLPVWMLTPAARRFDEAIELVQKFERAGRPIVVSRSWGIEHALQPDTLALERIGRIFFARATSMICWDEDLDWRGDRQRAGGGVLLYRGYGCLDSIVQAMGMPSSVYARMAGISRPGGRFPYDTEDTAGLVCQFTGGGVAVLSACWTAGPSLSMIEFYGTEGSIHIDNDHVVARDQTGQTERHRVSRSTDPLRIQIETFLNELSTSPHRIRSTLREHLSIMAVIHAAYLSAQTGQPEMPANIFAVHNVQERRPT